MYSCTLYSDALGHEIVPLSTLASPRAQVHCLSPARQVGLSACVSLCSAWSVCLACVSVYLSACCWLCVCRERGGWWLVLVSAGSLHLFYDWQNKWASVAVIMGRMENWSRVITEHFTLKSERGTKQNERSWFVEWSSSVSGKETQNHMFIHILIEQCVGFWIKKNPVLPCLWLMNWQISIDNVKPNHVLH